MASHDYVAVNERRGRDLGRQQPLSVAGTQEIAFLPGPSAISIPAMSHLS